MSDWFYRVARPRQGRVNLKIKRKLNVGDWVEVRSKEEILSTLDDKGQLDGTPFMPEMFRFCGQRFQVYKRAHKTCDYTTSYPYHTRRLEGTVHLETRCDGEAHGGCQAGCLLYWKQAWLKPVSGDPKNVEALSAEPSSGDVGVASSTGAANLRSGPARRYPIPMADRRRTSAKPRRCPTRRSPLPGGTCVNISRITYRATWVWDAFSAA